MNLLDLNQNLNLNASQFFQQINQVEQRMIKFDQRVDNSFRQYNRQLNRQTVNYVTKNYAGRQGGGGGGGNPWTSQFASGVLQANRIANLALSFMGIYAALQLIEGAMKAVVGWIDAGIRSAIHFATEFEKAEVMFGVMAGNAQLGKALFEDIQQLALVTPFQTSDLTRTAQMIMGMGVEIEGVIPVLSRLGDIAAGDTERLRRLALAFGQVVAAGRLRGEELRQFTEIGLGAKEFAITMGVGVREFRNLMKVGEVSSQVVIDTMNRLTNVGGRFAGMNAQSMNTVYGQWSNLVEKLQILGAKAAQMIFKEFDVAGGLDKLSGFIDKQMPVVLDLVKGAFVSLKPIAVGTLQVMGELWKQVTGQSSLFFSSIDKSPTAAEKMRQATLNFFDAVLNGFDLMQQTILETGRFIINFIIKPLLSAVQALEKIQIVGKLAEFGADISAQFAPNVDIDRLNKMTPEQIERLRNQGFAVERFQAQDFAAQFREGLRHAPDTRISKLLEDVEKMFSFAEKGAGGAVGALGTGVKEMRQRIEALRKQLPEAGEKAGEKAANKFAKGVANINLGQVLDIPKVVADFATKLKHGISEGINPFDKYLKERGLLGAALGAGPNVLTPEQFRIGRFQAFEQLRQAVEKEMKPELPSGALTGSQEAVEAINRNFLQSGSMTVADILKEAQEIEKQQNEKIDKTNEWLEKIEKNGFFKGRA